MLFVFEKIHEISTHLKRERELGKSIGFIPTMGALHDGHLSLVRYGLERCGCVVSSIFVNPTQFNDPNDFAKYPRTVEHDQALLEQSGCSVLFLPSVEEIYPPSDMVCPEFDFGYLDKHLEGAHRPGHFKGMAQVVTRLLEIVQPDELFMGQKDYQQAAIVGRMLQLSNSSVRLIICPTLRDPDGLAMSSRNVRLTPQQRQIALQLYQTLLWVRRAFEQTIAPNLAQISQEAFVRLQSVEGLYPEYIEIADGNTLELLQEKRVGQKVVALVAAKVGDVRLIDNLVLQEANNF